MLIQNGNHSVRTYYTLYFYNIFFTNISSSLINCDTKSVLRLLINNYYTVLTKIDLFYKKLENVLKREYFNENIFYRNSFLLNTKLMRPIKKNISSSLLVCRDVYHFTKKVFSFYKIIFFNTPQSFKIHYKLLNILIRYIFKLKYNFFKKILCKLN